MRSIMERSTSEMSKSTRMTKVKHERPIETITEHSVCSRASNENANKNEKSTTNNSGNELIVFKCPHAKESIVNTMRPVERAESSEIKEILDAETTVPPRTFEQYIETCEKRCADNVQAQVMQVTSTTSRIRTANLVFYEDLTREREEPTKERRTARPPKLVAKRRRHTDPMKLVYTFLCCTVNREELRSERAEDEYISRVRRQQKAEAETCPVNSTERGEKGDLTRDELKQRKQQPENAKNEGNLEKHSQTLNFVSPAKFIGQRERRPSMKRLELSKNARQDRQWRGRIVPVYRVLTKGSKNHRPTTSARSLASLNTSESRNEREEVSLWQEKLAEVNDGPSNQINRVSRSVSTSNPSSSRNNLRKLNEENSREVLQSSEENLKEDLHKENRKYKQPMKQNAEDRIPEDCGMSKQPIRLDNFSGQLGNSTSRTSKPESFSERLTASNRSQPNDFYSKASLSEGGRSITTQTNEDKQAVSRYPMHYETWNDPRPSGGNEDARLMVCKRFYGTCLGNPPRQRGPFPWLPESPYPDTASPRNDYQRIPNARTAGSSMEKPAFPWLQENSVEEGPQARCRFQRIPTAYLAGTTSPPGKAAFPWLQENPNGNCLSGRNCNLQAFPTSARAFGEFLQNRWTQNDTQERIPYLPSVCNVAELNRPLCQCGNVLGGAMIMNCCYCRRNGLDVNPQIIRTNCGYFNQ